MKPEWCDAISTCGSVAEWAAVAAARLSILISAFATVVAGLGAWAVWRLGKHANRLAEIPLKQAEDAERREREVILTLIAGDVYRASLRASELRAAFAKPRSLQRFVSNEGGFRGEIQRLYREVGMNSAYAVRGRFHVFPKNVSHALARATGTQQAGFGMTCIAVSPDATEVAHLTNIYRDLRRWSFTLAEDMDALSKLAAVVTEHGWPEQGNA